MGRKIKAFIFDKQTAEFITKLYMQYSAKMIKFAFSILNDWHDAEDSVEESFLNIARNSQKIINSECYEIRSYMVNTVKNTSLKILDKRNKLNYINISEIEEYVGCTESTEDITIAHISNEALEKVVEELKPRYKILLNMKYNIGYSNKEIAKVLDVKDESVRMMLSRMRLFLREKLTEGEMNEEGDK